MALPLNLIFDLGGVLYGIDFDRSVQALSEMAGGDRESEVYRSLREDDFWNAFESGALVAAVFRDRVRTRFGLDHGDSELDAAWNALLLGVLPDREAALEQLAKQHRIVLLSNTNRIHVQYLQGQCAGLFSFMEKCFFSYEMGLRKPDPRIFKQVLAEMDWKPEDCLFVDDSVSNVRAAQELDFQVFHFPKNNPGFLLND